MKVEARDIRVGLVLVVFLSFVASIPAAAQAEATAASGPGAKWGLIDAIGYGGLGFGLGVLATWERQGASGPILPSDLMIPVTGPRATALGYLPGDISLVDGPSGTTLFTVGATTAAGILAGAVIGRRAQHEIAEGRAVQGIHRAAVMGGGVMAGATMGALAAAALIIPGENGTFLGGDEQTVSLLVLVGSAVGLLYVWRHRDEFSSSPVGLVPILSGRGDYGLRVQVVF